MITEIPPLPVIPEELRRAALEGRLVPFIGTGASRLARCPSWEEFAQRLFDQLVNTGALNYRQAEQLRAHQMSPRARLSIARIIAKRKSIDLDYTTAIHPGRSLENPAGRRLYGALGRLSRSNVFVTTNYDAWLDEVIEPPSPGLSVVSDPSAAPPPTKRTIIHRPDEFSFQHLNSPNTVVHIHGSLDDPASMIVTTGDYLERYRYDGGDGMPDNKAVAFLRSLFKEKVVLFIGYGLDELEVLEYVILKSRSALNRSEGPKHFILQPYFSHEIDIAQHMEEYYAEECSVSLLHYLRDDRNFEQLIEVIEHFAREIPISPTLDIQRRTEMEGLLDD